MDEDATGGNASRPEAGLAKGTVVGQFVVLERLGGGGMGEVFLAYDPTLERQVALKVLHAHRAHGRADELVKEARAMAQATHPNLVAVHDVGEWNDQCFIVMEYVPGQTLGQWIQAGPHPVADVLEVFVKAAQGLRAAHAKGVVHRDFKPDNVLLGEHGRVAITDFGLSVSGGAAQGPEGRRYSGGTPRYMAPEQVRGERPTPQTDQFSFCVSLFEALYGRPPFQGETLPQLMHRITLGEVDWNTTSRPVPVWLRRVLRRGLAVEPPARFSSMEELIEVLGRDPQKRARRWAFAATAGLAIVGLSTSSYSAVKDYQLRCHAPSDALQGTWTQPLSERLKSALQMSGARNWQDISARVTTRLDNYADAWRKTYEQSCRATHFEGQQSETMLDKRSECLTRRKNELRALTSRLTGTLEEQEALRAIDAVHRLTPIASCSDVERLAQTTPLPEDPREVETAGAIRTRLAQSRADEWLGRMASAQQHAEKALQQAEALAFAQTTAEALEQTAWITEQSGNHEASETALRKAIRAAADARDTRMHADLWVRLYRAVGERKQDLAQAEWVFDQADANVRLAGNRPNHRASLENYAGYAQIRRGKYREAIAHFRQALEVDPKHKATAPRTYISALVGLASAHRNLGEGEDALRVLGKAISLASKVLGADHPDAAMMRSNLGNIFLNAGQMPQAEEAYGQAVASFERSLGPNDARLAFPVVGLGLVHMYAERFDKAEALYRRGYELRKNGLSERHPLLLDPLLNLGEVLLAQNRLKDAIAPLREAVAIALEKHGEAHLRTVFAQAMLSHALATSGDTAEARALAERASSALDKLGEDTGLFGASIRFRISTAYREMGEREHATAMVEDTLAQLTRMQDTTLMAEALFLKAMLADDNHDRTEARAVGAQALKLLQDQARPALQKRVEAFLATQPAR